LTRRPALQAGIVQRATHDECSSVRVDLAQHCEFDRGGTLGNNAVNPYVARANVDHFLDLLREDGISDQIRHTVTKLLVAQEDQLGRTVEALSFMESRLIKGREDVASIRLKCKVFAHGTEQHIEAEKLLVNLENTLTLMENYCQRLRTDIDRNGL
jgi:hypothetical protein